LGLQQAPQDINHANLKRLSAAGIKVLGLEYGPGERALGSGWMDPKGKLSNLGRQLLEDMADQGMILDLSHSGHQTAEDALAFIEKEKLELPVMASHGGVYEWYEGSPSDFDNLRNHRLDTLHEIYSSGGLIGIFALTFSLSGSDNTQAPFIDQLARAARLFRGGVAIGSDSIYQTRDPGEWQRTYNFMLAAIAKDSPMQPRFPDYSSEINRVDKLDFVEEELEGAGLNSEQTASVMGNAAVQFFWRSL
jgi:microsomal dipeptidase-like Zn-dependent dipeptidase